MIGNSNVNHVLLIIYSYCHFKTGRISMVRMAQLLLRKTSCFEPPRSGFTDLGSIPGQGKIMNVSVLYHEVNMVLWTLYTNV